MKASLQEQSRSLFRDLYQRKFFDSRAPNNTIERVTKFQQKIRSYKFDKNSSLSSCLMKQNYLNDRLDNFKMHTKKRFMSSRISDYWNNNYEPTINPEKLPISESLNIQKRLKNYDSTETNRSQTAELSKIAISRQSKNRSQISKRVIIGGHDLQKQGQQYRKKAKEIEKSAKLARQSANNEEKYNKSKQIIKKRFFFRYQLKNVIKTPQKNMSGSRKYIFDRKISQNRTERFEEIIDLRPWAVFEHQFF